MSVYAFAITTETPVQNTGSGTIEPYSLPSMFQFIQNKTAAFKIRFQARPPARMHIYSKILVDYSSIALFSFEEQDSAILTSTIKDALDMYAPLSDANRYVLTPMEIYEDIAFVLCDGDPTVYNPKFHNEWFSMPVSTEALTEYDESKMPFNNIIYEFNGIGIGEPLKKYKGNLKHVMWIVEKTSSGRYTTTVNGKKCDGIYDGTKDKINIIYHGPSISEGKAEIEQLKKRVAEQDEEIRRLTGRDSSTNE